MILNGQLCKLTYQHLCKREIGFLQLFFVVFQKHKNRYICDENHKILNVMIYKMFKKSSILRNVIAVENQEVVEACI